MSRPHRVAVAPADGIGPEIVDSATRIATEALEQVGAASAIDWFEIAVGRGALEASGDALPPESVAALRDSSGLVLGPVDHATYPRRPGGPRQNPSGELRKHFDLFANVRPARTMPGIPAVGAGVDLVVVR